MRWWSGSVVTRDVPAGCVAYGNPARARHSVDDLVDLGVRVEEVEDSASRFRFAAPVRS